ncbi:MULTISPECIES: histone deacetylase family protein [Marinomonas]|uniref:Histone deacetylase family protein n=1 Tax=Marinomonas arctica TaxID=383750 RepID=A0A7H1J7X0_9GAMM|nr:MULTISPECIES: histone deacetylase family protein [Marinomonas]MCS7488660.1 deacetylase [Marinomonas sp. BSi20414]QNT06586.1 histone deacetylase family protein [Marinomonas arctica]GGN39422.1 deacetylase [Marinomonas arctica]
MTTAYITHTYCDRHDMGEDHPESPLRLGAIQNRLIMGQLMDFIRRIEADLATRDQLIATHDTAYVDSIFARAPAEGHVELEPETIMMPHTLDAALFAAGSVVKAVDLVMTGEMDNAFCAIRPPGHHAEYDKAMGFCLFNNIAVGARHAINRYGLARVAIIDFDVHHGNGTEDIFKADPTVLYASSYQHPFYPYSDPGASYDNILHMPLAAGSGSEAFQAIISEQLLPALEAFKPQLIMISAGFDAHKEDPMGQLRLSESDFTWITDRLMEVADRHCGGKVVSVLEGGYNIDALGRAAFCHIKSLMRL